MLNKKLTLILIFTIFILASGVAFAADNLTSEKQLGDSVNISGSTFDDIQKAVDNASENDIIHLNGSYTSSGKEITINKNIVIQGNNTTLDAQVKSRIFNINANKVTFLNINFINSKTSTNGGAIFSNGEVVIINSTFKNNIIKAPDTWDYSTSSTKANGGAVYADKITIENSTFTANSVTCNELYNEDYIFKINAALGGAIYSKTDLIISNSLFDNNRAGEASAIYINGKAKIIKCNFTNNAVSEVFTIRGAENSNVQISDSKFVKNSNVIYTDGNINIDNSDFTDNSGIAVSSQYYGNNNILINVSNSRFSNNLGGYGGAIYVDNNCSVVNSVFTGNRGEYGGAISSVDELYVKNCTFTNNYAVEGGGAIKCRNANIYSSEFISNSVNDYRLSFSGGAIYADGVCSIYDSNFTKNSANLGGGIYTTQFSDNYKLLISNCKFSENSHGAIVSSKSKITIKNKSSYNGNTALNNDLNSITLIKSKTAKVSTTYKSGKTLDVKLTYADGGVVKRMGVMLKAVNGKTKKYLYAETNSKGIAKFKVSALPVGSYKVTVSSDDIYPISKATSSVKITKAKTVVKAQKVTNKFKKSKYFKITVKDKSTKKAVKKVKIKLKVFTGKKSKIYTVKTNAKGLAKFNTKKLTKGSHKVVVSSGNANYKISAKSRIIIK